MKSRLALLSSLVLWAASSPAQMYKWVDERGVTHYSEKPPPGRKSQQIQAAPAPPAVPASPSTPAGSQANPAPTWNDQERDFRRRQIEREQAAEKKQNEERQRAAMRRELCLDARQAVAALSESRPVYSINQKGEREYIEDSARPAALQRARQNVETYCRPE